MHGHDPLGIVALSTLLAAASFDVLPPGAQLTTPTPKPVRFAVVGVTLPTDDAFPAFRPVDTGIGRPVYVKVAHRTYTGDGIRDAVVVEALPPGADEAPRPSPRLALPRAWTLESLQDAVIAALPEGASATSRPAALLAPPRIWTGDGFRDGLPPGVSDTARPRSTPAARATWARDGNAFAAPEAVPDGGGATAKPPVPLPVPRTWAHPGNAFAFPEIVPQGAGMAAGPPTRPVQPRTAGIDQAATLLLHTAPPGAQEATAPALPRRAAPWAVPNLPPAAEPEPLPPSPAPPGPPPRAPRYALVGDSRPGDDGTAPPTPLPDGASSNTQPVPPYAVVRGETANVLDLLVAPVAPMPPGVGSLDRPVRVRPYVPDALFWYIQEAEAPVGRSVPALPPTVRQRPLNVIDRPALVLDTPPAALPPGTSLAPAPRVLGPLVVAGHHVTARDVDAAAPTPLPPNTGVSIARPVAPRPAVIASYDVDLPEAAAPIIPDVPAPPQRPVRLSVSATGGVPPPDAAPAALPPFNATSTPRLSTPRPIGAATRNTLLLEPDVALPMGQAAWPYVRPRVALTPCVTGSPWLLDVAPVGATTQTRPTPSTRVATRTFTQDGLRRAFRAEWAQGANVVINRHRTTT